MKNDVTHRPLRLRRHVPALSVQCRADVDQLIAEVDVPPVKAQQFPLAKTAEDRCGKESAEARCRRFEKAPDLLGVEHRPFLPRNPWPFAAVELADRVDLDQAASHRMREQP